MKINIFCDDIKELKADVLVVLNEKGRVAVRGPMVEINKQLDGKVSEILESGEFSGDQDNFLYFFSFGKTKVSRIALVGFDLNNESTLNPIRSATAIAAKSLRQANVKKIAFLVPAIKNSLVVDVARTMIEGVLLGLYRFEKYKENKSDKNITEIILVSEAKDKRAIEKAVLLGEMEASGVLLARDLGNEPSNYLTPTNFANIVAKLMTKVKVRCKILDENDIKTEGLGLIHGVAKGSQEPPRLVLMNYTAGKKYPTIALVGKGITFDSGGISLKVGEAAADLLDMKRDMAGAGAVVGAMHVLGQIKPKINVIGVVPLLENMPSGSAYKPSDILISYSGKSVEIFNTDAEGRLALADAMSYVQKNYKVDYVIDIATLTGAVLRATGPSLSGLFGNDERLLERVRKAGLAAGEETMTFPLYEGYRSRVKTHFADIKNISYKAPGTISSALFLEEFVEQGVKWSHLDIAGKESHDGDGTYLTRGATGIGVRLLTHLVLGMGK